MIAAPPNLIVRADADSVMGTGHVMRCVGLAQGWQDRGGKVTFVGHIANQSLQQRISNEGFRYVDIEQPYPEPDDLQVMLSLLETDVAADDRWVVVDGYHFTVEYTTVLRDAGAKVMVIDDYAHQPQYQADILLNQNMGSEKIDYPVNSDASILAGNEYVLLRREFLEQKSTTPRDTPIVGKHILITMGGADPENVTLTVIEALAQVDLPELEIKIVVGAANPNADLLEKRLAQVSFNWELLRNLNNMVPLMQWADIAITAGGSTCWELACLGVPALIVVVAENQLSVAEGLTVHGAGNNCGLSQSLQADGLAVMINDLCGNVAVRKAMTQAGKKLVDGHGAMRVVEKMVALSFSFRPVRLDDCRQLYEWANDPVVRNASFCMDDIGWEDHQHWFKKRLNDENCSFWIVQNQAGKPVGQVRFDIADNEAVISISLAEVMRNKGMGSRIIKSACDRLLGSGQICQVRAFVKLDNLQSLKVFEHAGFEMIAEKVIHGVAAMEMSLTRK